MAHAEESAEEPWHTLHANQVLSRLDTGWEGLTEEEATLRLRRFGPNEVPTEEKARPATILVRQVKSPLVYILLAAAAAALALQKYVDASVILVVVVLNSVVGFVQEFKAEQAMKALAESLAPRARVLRDGVERETDARLVVPGDLVLLESGVRVPADLRLLRAFDLQIDESILTGESVPVVKHPQAMHDPSAPLADRINMVFSGTSVVRGRGAGVVVATGLQTAFGQISAQVRLAGEVESPLQLRLSRFARLIAGLVLAVTILVFGLGLGIGVSLPDILLTAVATAVATVPEGLPVTITVALAVGVWRMARRKAIIRKLPAVETLGSCTVICSDKTGTLTKNEMTVTSIHAGGRLYSVTGSGYAPVGEILADQEKVQLKEHPELELTLRIGMLANESSLYLEDGD